MVVLSTMCYNQNTFHHPYVGTNLPSVWEKRYRPPARCFCSEEENSLFRHQLTSSVFFSTRRPPGDDGNGQPSRQLQLWTVVVVVVHKSSKLAHNVISLVSWHPVMSLSVSDTLTNTFTLLTKVGMLGGWGDIPHRSGWEDTFFGYYSFIFTLESYFSSS